jgi:hypothetical protein
VSVIVVGRGVDGVLLHHVAGDTNQHACTEYVWAVGGGGSKRWHLSECDTR